MSEMTAEERASDALGWFFKTPRDSEEEQIFDDVVQAIRQAVQAERERCAKVAEGFTGHQDEDIRKMGLPTQGEAVAAAIRALKD